MQDSFSELYLSYDTKIPFYWQFLRLNIEIPLYNVKLNILDVIPDNIAKGVQV